MAPEVCPALGLGQRLRVAFAGDDQVRAELPDALDLGRSGHGRDEDLGRHAPPVRGVGDRHAVVAAGGRYDPGRRHVPQQQVGESPPGLERPRALQLLELEPRHPRPAGVGEVDLDHGRPADVGPDRVVAAADIVSTDHAAKHTQAAGGGGARGGGD
jgi:hypothetical protein